MTAPRAQTPPNSRFWYAAPHFVAFVSFIPALYLWMLVGLMVGLPLWGHIASSALIMLAPITSAALILKFQGRPVGWKRKTLRSYAFSTVFATLVVVVTFFVGEAVLPSPGELPEDFDSYLLWSNTLGYAQLGAIALLYITPLVRWIRWMDKPSLASI
jgi:hypothetical protein